MEKTCSTCKYVNVVTWHNDKVWYCNGQKNTPLVYPNDTCDGWSPKAELYNPETTEDLLTNAERIRAMTDDELAEFLDKNLCDMVCRGEGYCDDQCTEHILDWLKLREEPEEPILKPCPFCGGEAKLYPYSNITDWWSVGCETSGCIGNHNDDARFFSCKKSAIEAWNRRAADD